MNPVHRRILAAAALLLAAGAGLWTARQLSAGPAAHDGHADDGSHAAHAVTSVPAAPDAGAQPAVDAAVQLDLAQVRALGIVTVAAELGEIRRELRTTGNVTFDETRLSMVTPKFSGFVERLHVDFTGQAVRRGQALLEIYSPELVAAQEELLTAVRMQAQLREGASVAVVERTAGLVDAARRRLLLWDVSPAQVQQVERTGRALRTVTLHAPFSGFVVEKLVQAGQAVDAGMPLYRLADLSTVWVEADVYEQDLRFLRLAEPVEVEIAAYPGERFAARIGYIYPEVRPDTRTTRVRAQLPNAGGRVKPGMFATVRLDVPVTERAVLVPRDAVMHSGTHAMVFVEDAPGHYRAREVRVGLDHAGRTQILAGLLAGERIVARANFLLDAESRLSEGMGAMPGMDH